MGDDINEARAGVDHNSRGYGRDGCGIQDIKQARQPLYSSLGEERAGLGFAVMESFIDKLRVRSKPGAGTTIVMEKHIRGRDAL